MLINDWTPDFFYIYSWPNATAEQGRLPRYQLGRSKSSRGVRCLLEPVSWLPGCLPRLPLRPGTLLFRLSARHRQHDGEEHLRPTDKQAGNLGPHCRRAQSAEPSGAETSGHAASLRGKVSPIWYTFNMLEFPPNSRICNFVCLFFPWLLWIKQRDNPGCVARIRPDCPQIYLRKPLRIAGAKILYRLNVLPGGHSVLSKHWRQEWNWCCSTIFGTDDDLKYMEKVSVFCSTVTHLVYFKHVYFSMVTVD